MSVSPRKPAHAATPIVEALFEVGAGVVVFLLLFLALLFGVLMPLGFDNFEFPVKPLVSAGLTLVCGLAGALVTARLSRSWRVLAALAVTDVGLFLLLIGLGGRFGWQAYAGAVLLAVPPVLLALLLARRDRRARRERADTEASLLRDEES
ncbi:MAG: hypothetical protein EOO11_11700 [Chitinophagaceae bacterium]|nr:MAG: hypothetical protein EOO11_11700 [Chitinophagaceae bacterium]